MNSTTSTTIFLTRHSRTTGNEMHVMQGWSDFPLSVEGVRIAQQFGRGLRGLTFDSAYCGNLTRHYDTARIALECSGNAGLPINVDPDLREDNFGSFEGRSADQVQRVTMGRMGCHDIAEAEAKYGADLMVRWQDAMHDLDFENVLHTDLADEDRAESSEQIRARIVPAIKRIMQESQRRGDSNVLVVSSGSVIAQFLRAVIPEAVIPEMQNTAVTKIVDVNGELNIVGQAGSMEYYERGAQQ